MKKRILLLFLYVGIAFGQEANHIKLSSEATFSVVTCGAGTELYSSFGHSAFRLKDPVYGYDVVYNYGTFDFNTPLFYVKFAQGKLPYQLGRSNFRNFINIYRYEKRWVKEQVLNLTPEQNRQLLSYLENNYKPENRDYKYDFFFNNCATKIRDVIKENFGNEIIFHEDHLPIGKTFRDLIHDNLATNSWSSFGIDIALGAVIDKPALAEEYQFLPEYVFKAFENAALIDGTTPLITKTATILKAPENEQEQTSFLLSPYFIFGLLLLIVLIITFLDLKNNIRSRWLDATLLFINGVVGIIILLLWFATDHTATAMNMNVLWLFPINIFFVRKFLLKRKECSSLWKHTAFLIFLLLVAFFLWLIDFQQFAMTAIPLMLLFLIRYTYLTYYFRKLES